MRTWKDKHYVRYIVRGHSKIYSEDICKISLAAK